VDICGLPVIFLSGGGELDGWSRAEGGRSGVAGRRRGYFGSSAIDRAWSSMYPSEP